MYMTGIIIKKEEDKLVIDYKTKTNKYSSRSFIADAKLIQNYKCSDFVYIEYNNNKIINIGLVDNIICQDKI